MPDPRPTPAQARLLRLLLPAEARLEVWFSWVEVWHGTEKVTNPKASLHRASIMAARRFGWLESAMPPAGKNLWSEQDRFYRLSDLGRRVVEGLPQSAFVSRERPRAKGKAAAIYRALAFRHPPPEWVFITEAPTGRPNDRTDGKIDALAVNCFYTKKYVRIGYEIKVTRSDFLRDLKRPDKLARAAAYCSSFYFAVPIGLVRPEEVPDPYGLVVVYPKGTCRMKKRSRLPEVPASWEVAAKLLRRVAELS